MSGDVLLLPLILAVVGMIAAAFCAYSLVRFVKDTVARETEAANTIQQLMLENQELRQQLKEQELK